MVTEVLTTEKNSFERTENGDKESFMSCHFWLHFSRLELTFHVTHFPDCDFKAEQNSGEYGYVKDSALPFNLN